MKKALSLLLCLSLLAAVLTGCKPNAPVSDNSSNASQNSAASAGGSEASDTGTETEGNTAVVDGIATGYYEYDDFSAEHGELTFSQAPSLDSKDLPDIAERLPDNPIVYQPVTNNGKYGGEIVFSSTNIDQDWTLRNMNTGVLFELNPDPGVDSSNSPLESDPLPGIFEEWGYDNEGKWFEFKIRKGIKWSDGEPVTSDDIRFFVEDILLNKELYPVAPNWLIWQGHDTKVTFPDEYTFRVEFEEPYGGYMLKELRVWNAYYGRIMVPEHFLKKYHKDYGDEAEILKDMEQYGFYSMDEWAKYYLEKKTAIYGVDYIGMPNGEQYPSLDPWIVCEDLGNGNYRYERNPYFYMVDTQGRQLPYIDNLKRTYVSDSEVLNMDIISGKVDIASASLTIEDFPLYSDNEEKGDYRVLALPAYQDHDLVYAFNLAAKDPVKREVYSDLRFRQAVSMALDRKTMNETMYLGLGTPAQDCPRTTSKYFEEGMDTSYAEYNPEESMRLLDEMGMKDTDGDGYREAPDGSPFTVNCDWFVVSGSSQSGIEYMKRYLDAIGIRMNLKQIDPSYYWSELQPNNDNELSVWWLGGAGADTLEGWFSGLMVATPLWWNWANYYYNGVPEEKWTNPAEEPPQWAKDNYDAFFGIRATADPDEIVEYAKTIWNIEKENLHTIGVAHDIKVPFVVKNGIGNVTEFEEVGVPPTTVLEQSHGWYKE